MIEGQAKGDNSRKFKKYYYVSGLHDFNPFPDSSSSDDASFPSFKDLEKEQKLSDLRPPFNEVWFSLGRERNEKLDIEGNNFRFHAENASGYVQVARVPRKEWFTRNVSSKFLCTEELFARLRKLRGTMYRIPNSRVDIWLQGATKLMM